MTDHKTKINVVEDADATGEVALVYDEWRAHSGRQQMPVVFSIRASQDHSGFIPKI
jgi:hypothetical protein